MTTVGEERAIRRNAVSILTTVHPPFDTRIFHKQADGLESMLVAFSQKIER